MRIYPPEHRIDPCLHGLHAQGFDNIIISTDIEPFYHVILPIECRNEDDGNLRRGRILFHLMRHLESRHVLHHHIQKNQCVFRQIQRQCLLCRINGIHLVPFRLKIKFEYLADVLLIIHNKYFHDSSEFQGTKIQIISEKKIGFMLQCY